MGTADAKDAVFLFLIKKNMFKDTLAVIKTVMGT